MKKLFFSLTLLIILFIGGIYALVFTAPGNSIVASYIEDAVNEEGTVSFKVEKFVLTTESIDFVANIDDNSTINVKGSLALLAKTVDLTYDMNIKDLSKLKKFTQQQLNGTFNTKGTLKGDQGLALLNGTTDIFESQTTYNVKLVEFEPSNILFNMKAAKIDKVLYLVNQPKYANGFVDINANITNAKVPTLDGLVTTKIYKGLVNNPVVNKGFNLQLKKPLAFKGNIVTNLVPNTAVTKADVYTTVANVFSKEAKVHLDTGLITSDYLVNVGNLAKLYDVTQMKMRGKIDINGNIKKDKNLLVTGTSNLLDGKLDFKLLNDDFSSTIKGVEVLKAMHMMYYPEMFTSKTNLNLNYNLATSKGLLEGELLDGQFKKNQFSTVINQLARFDLTKEVYETVNIKSDINKQVIESVVNMKSSHTQIDVTSSTLNMEKRTIDALVKTNLKGIKFDTVVSGSLDKPKVKIDTSKLATSAIKAKAKESIKKKIEENIGGKAGNLLKGLFN